MNADGNWVRNNRTSAQPSSDAPVPVSPNARKVGDPKFEDYCRVATKKAAKGQLRVDIICRFNRDDNMIIRTRNFRHEGLGTSKGGWDEGYKSPWGNDLTVSTIRRIKPVFPMIEKHLEEREHPDLEHQNRQILDLEYFEYQRKRIIDEGRPTQEELERTRRCRLAGDYSFEARIKYMKEYVPSGLVGEHFLQQIENELRDEAVKCTDVMLRGHKQQMSWKLGEVKEGEKALERKAKQEREERTKSLNRQAHFELLRTHGTSDPYSHEWVQLEPDCRMGQGGHAEEILIRLWPSAIDKLAVQGKQLEHVDLFISSMPCPDGSAGFQMAMFDQVKTFKEGCINKLIQLVSSTTADATFEITYGKEENREKSEYTKELAKRGFPERVKFEKFNG